MDFVQIFQSILSFAIAAFILLIICSISISWWILPNLAHKRLRKNGISGPEPRFPLGNLNDMVTMMKKRVNNDDKTLTSSSSPTSTALVSHNIHPVAFPYFAQWQKSYGKVFNYWLGTEPFVYIADPEFLKKMSRGVMGKSWGKPNVFKNDRKAMFGKGLVMVEGDDWVRHRHIISPAFSSTNVKAMSSLMKESATKMLDQWAETIRSSEKPEIEVEKEIIDNAGEIIAKTSFGISYENGQKVLEKLREVQMTLFKSNRYVGVPFSKYLMSPKKSIEAKNLGDEIDSLLLTIIESRKKKQLENNFVDDQPKDLLGMLLAQDNNKGTLSSRDLVDECKTFFFAGHETTALSLTWSLLLLAVHPEWQDKLREEIKEVVGDQEIDPSMLGRLRKMGWVMNEAMRLYSPAPNVQRQARSDIRVDDIVIPTGTNIWVDVVSMHHDKELWGDDVNEFKPERFQDDITGGCKHKMGFLPFGFGGRMCIGRNLTIMEYKIVLTLILTRFSFSLSPNYCHSPAIMLSLRPTQGLPLVLRPLYVEK
ncbi:oxygenase [Lithospermum erythrorhizon]|uniref:Oxygenase n=1 Tax=Lithospermum erythrorhizon TaxID=34254 RepID=A0AAV3P9R8_LITER